MSFILPLTAAILLVVCGIAFALWKKNKTANYTILGLSAAAFGFFFYMGFLWPSNFTEIRVMGINNNYFIGLSASSILLFSSAAIIHNQNKPETDQPEQEQPTQPTEKTEKKPAAPAHAEQKAPGKLSQTVLKGLASLEVTVHFDEEQLDQIATIVTERQSHLQQTSDSEPEPVSEPKEPTEPSAEAMSATQTEPEKTEVETQAASEAATEEPAGEVPKKVPLIRHAKTF